TPTKTRRQNHSSSENVFNATRMGESLIENFRGGRLAQLKLDSLESQNWRAFSGVQAFGGDKWSRSVSYRTEAKSGNTPVILFHENPGFRMGEDGHTIRGCS